MEASPDEGAVKVVERTTKDLEYYTHLIKQRQDLRELTPMLEEVLLGVQSYQTASYATEKSLVKGGGHQSANFIVVLC